MNFLAHHALARRLAPDRPPAFFVGNVLPDLVASARAGRLRARHVAGAAGELAEGVRLHLSADQRFHGDPAFVEATLQARALLLDLPPPAPRRVFFLAHVAAELALDGALLQAEPALADDLLDAVANSPVEAIASQAASWLEVRREGVVDALLGFARSGYVRHYRHGEGLAEGLHRIACRAGLEGFSVEARAALAQRLPDLFVPWAAQGNGLLQRAGGAWYNSRVQTYPGEGADRADD